MGKHLPIFPAPDDFASLVIRARAEHPGDTLAIPIVMRLLADQLTPVLAYRRLVAADEREAPSFLFESVEGGERAGRYSILGAHPVISVTATRNQSGVQASIQDSIGLASRTGEMMVANPIAAVREITSRVRLVKPESGRRSAYPASFLGGWVGYASYDSVRYIEGQSLKSPPPDDRDLPELSFGFYDGVVIFDNIEKLVFLIQLVIIKPSDDALAQLRQATSKLNAACEQIQCHSKPLASGAMLLDQPRKPTQSNLTRDQHQAMVAKAKEYIKAGDIFQVVLGQRFERKTTVDPFDVYRALRVVNPSPYLVYLQTPGAILVASSPEILCRVRQTDPAHGTPGSFTVTNRPLAGTRKRGTTHTEDAALAAELLADPKERAEHIMLVDLGRNDVGVVAKPGSIQLPAIMEVERYSHVMHISSTVTGELRDGLDCWDALAAALPVGTISGAPKVRAMQIIDELEPIRRGPYGGGMGYVGLDGQMDIALALRTIVVPLNRRDAATGTWTYHLQASGGIVADSDAELEYQETVNKAAALAAAIDIAESAFLDGQ